MNIDKTHNTSFKGIVHLRGQAKANDPILRPLIHHLKYHCGNKNVHHSIDVCDINNSIKSVNTVYRSKVKIFDGFGIKWGGGREKTAEYIKELIGRTDALNLTYRIFKNEERKVVILRTEIEYCKGMFDAMIKPDAKVIKEPISFLEGLAVFLAKNKSRKTKK